MSGKLVVTQSRYVASAVKPEQYPNSGQPEIVFMGRSNVGKSSLINSLTGTSKLARVSASPGKTQTINFYDVGLKEAGGERRNFYLVDLPGYGYAKTGKKQRHEWAKFIEAYLVASPHIRFVCQLIDIRHPPMTADIAMFHWLVERGLSVLVVATKADKIGKNAVAAQVAAIRRSLGVPELAVLAYSAWRNDGREALLKVISESLPAPLPNTREQ